MKDIRYKQKRTQVIEWGENKIEFGSKTYLMGILNVTPDSFSDGGNYTQLKDALAQVSIMVGDGADIIDVGGESTRPGSEPVDIDTEINRVVPFIKGIKDYFDITVSLDTSKSEVALAGLEAGADMINDVWGLQKDPRMAFVVAKYKVPVVIMHNQIGTQYNHDIIKTIKKFFKESIKIAKKAGIKKELIILDPGIGFGKNQEQNREVLARIGELKKLGYPILLGTSRKSIIGSILDLPPTERIEGTLATSTMGIISGVDIIRVHDVKENKRVALVTDKIVRI